MVAYLNTIWYLHKQPILEQNNIFKYFLIELASDYVLVDN